MRKSPKRDEYEPLGEFAAKALKPGGLLLSYCGVVGIKEALDGLSRHLEPVWVVAIFRPWSTNRVHYLSLMSQWEPVLLFCKGEFKSWGIPQDVVKVPVGSDAFLGSGPEKRWHPWQKPVKEIETLIGRFSRPGDLVVDPAFGSATSLIATLILNREHANDLPRRWAGCDSDPGCLNLLHARWRKFESGEPDRPD